ncbi:MAG: DUF6056 family protein [Saprospiraceae bacterium]|nr:DUF6056 family protein [Saprospiraceae bacterium]
MTKIKKTEILIILGLLVLVAPFFFLSFYCHPSADDFIFSATVKNHNFWEYQQLAYNSWGGRYFGTFIVSINPLCLDWMFGYKLVPIVLFVLLYFSIYFLFKMLLENNFQSRTIHLISLIFYVLYLNVMPSTAEGFYWLTGALGYTFANIILLFCVALLIKLNSIIKRIHKILYFILALILSLFVVGANEISMMVLFEIIGLILIYDFIINREINITYFVILAFTLAAAFIVFYAPGTQSKLNNLPNHFNLGFSIVKSVELSFMIIGFNLQSFPFIIVSLIFIPFANSLSKSNNTLGKIGEISPYISIPISFAIIFSLYFVAYFSLGNNPAWRVHNNISLVFIILWFLNILIIVKFFKNKNYSVPPTPQYLTTLLIVIAFLFTFIDFHIKDPKEGIKFKGNIAHAYYDLIFKAPAYNKEINTRYLLIQKAKKENSNSLEVEKIKNIPQTIIYQDITEDAENWMNAGMANYYGIKAIKVKAED